VQPAFGERDVPKDESRGPRGTRLIGDLAADVRFGARMLRRSPVFTIAATLTLALGLGLNLAVFAVADGLLFRPLPYGDPGRLFLLLAPRPSGGSAPGVLGAAVIAAGNSRTLAAIGGVTGTGTLEPRDPDDPIWQSQEVTENLFDVLRVKPVLGRPFTRGDGTRRPVRVGLLTHGAWRRRFGGDSHVPGRVLEFRDGPVEIAGVLPDGFIPAERTPKPGVEIYVADEPFLLRAQPSFTYLPPVVRLQDGATAEQAQAELDATLETHWRAAPAAAQVRVFVTSLHAGMFASWRPSVIGLLLAASLVFALATVNLANLLLARGLGRQREIALRATLGASGSRVCRQLAVESALLGVLAAGAALLLYEWSYPLVSRLLPPVPAAMLTPSLDTRVMVALAGLTCLANVAFAVVGARQATRVDLRLALGRARTGSMAVGPAWARSLVAIEVTLATLVLVSASVIVTSFTRLASEPLGFDDRNLYVVTSTLPARATETPANRFARQTDALDAIRRDHSDPAFEAASCSIVQAQCRSASGLVEATSGYLDVAGTPIVRGRMFTRDEERAHLRVAIVSAGIASARWPGQDPLGRRVTALDGSSFDLIGVAADIHQRRDATAASMILVPWGTLRLGTMSIVTRTPAGLDAVHQAVAAAVRTRLPDARITVTPVSDRSLVTPRMLMTLFGAFGAVALLVAGIGIFGIQAVVVAGRRMEIAVRIALGGHPSLVTRRVVGRALVPVAVGLGVGLIASAAAATWTANALRQGTLLSPLHRTTPHDAGAWTAGVAILFGVSVLSAWLPARGASRRDPAAVLKSE
jgi:putative ABC transport system permease protein